MSLTTELEDTPWVHLTYLFDDESMGQHGRGACAISCQRCGEVWLLQYDSEEVVDDGMLVVRNKFEYMHRNCPVPMKPTPPPPAE